MTDTEQIAEAKACTRLAEWFLADSSLISLAFTSRVFGLDRRALLKLSHTHENVICQKNKI